MRGKLDIRRYTVAIRKKLWIIIIVTLLSAAIGWGCNYKVKDNQYKSSATIYSDSFCSYTSSLDKTYIRQNYSDIILSKRVADKAAEIIDKKKIDGYFIKSCTTLLYKEQSPVYYIYATTNDPELSLEIANAVAQAAVTELNDIKGEVVAKKLDEAYEYEKVFDGRKVQIINIAIISLIGLLISVIAIIITAILSNKVEFVKDVGLNGEIEILGVIPNFDVE